MALGDSSKVESQLGLLWLDLGLVDWLCYGLGMAPMRSAMVTSSVFIIETEPDAQKDMEQSRKTQRNAVEVGGGIIFVCRYLPLRT